MNSAQALRIIRKNSIFEKYIFFLGGGGEVVNKPNKTLAKSLQFIQVIMGRFSLQ